MTARARVGAVAVALVTVAALTAPAGADPVGDKQREAQQIANRIEQLSDRAADFGEALNGAQLALSNAQADVKASEDKLAGLEQKLNGMRATLSAYALKAYVYADQTGGLVGLLSGTSLTEGAAQRAGYQAVALGANVDMTDDVKAVIEDTRAEQAVLDARKQKVARLADAYASAKTQAEQALAQQQSQQVKVKGELANLVAQEQARRAAAAAAAAKAAAQQALARANGATPGRATPATPAAPQPATPQQPAGGGDTAQKLVSKPVPAAPPQIDIPPTSGGAGTAVRAALSQVGKAYRFAAAGPDAYDCSGLTMWAWSQAGVSLPHYSKAQYDSVTHVPLSAIQPGDLVFFYGDIHHVGIYIGGGQMVDAANPALGVRVAGIGGAIGAARPG
ncbi:MAG TPA: NlpC/P60 family protein [Acidimicrobiales bacterium]|nr:NlpC/P60 family protein [Acidimicrobiales bacterium]